MDNWVGKACKAPEINFDPFQAFDTLTQFPDEGNMAGRSIGCKRKNKAACKNMPAISAPSKNDKPAENKPTNKPNSDSPTTRIDQSATSQSISNAPTSQISGVSTSLQSSAAASSSEDVDGTAKSQSTQPSSQSRSPSDRSSPSSYDSSSSNSQSTEPGSACGLVKRAKPVKVNGVEVQEGKIGEDEKSTECARAGRDKTVHITKTKVSIGWYTSVLPQTCSRGYSQACYHYRSVMSVHTLTPDMVQFTCGATANTNQDGEATEKWGSTNIAPLPAKRSQHNFAWANGFVELTTEVKQFKNKQKTITHGCDRDEWPPRYFWPGDDVAAKEGRYQRIRFVPAQDNRKAGQIWNQFCNNNAAQVTRAKKYKRGQAPLTKEYKSYIQSAWIRSIGTAIVDKPIVVKQTTTIVSTVSVETGRAVFTFADWDGLPDDKDWHGLKENRYWPKALAADDPGWALLTDDDFYLTQHKDLAKSTAQYAEYPDLALLQAALLVRDPVNSIRDLNAAEALLKFGNDGIPLELQGVLPGIPKFSKPKPPRCVRGISFYGLGNVSLPMLNGPSAWHFGDEDIDPDDMSDDEWSDWMSNYIEEVLEDEDFEEETPTSPSDVEAVPTPIGQGDPTAVPALQGSLASAGLPVATTFVS